MILDQSYITRRLTVPLLHFLHHFLDLDFRSKLHYTTVNCSSFTFLTSFFIYTIWFVAVHNSMPWQTSFSVLVFYQRKNIVWTLYTRYCWEPVSVQGSLVIQKQDIITIKTHLIPPFHIYLFSRVSLHFIRFPRRRAVTASSCAYFDSKDSIRRKPETGIWNFIWPPSVYRFANCTTVRNDDRS